MTAKYCKRIKVCLITAFCLLTTMQSFAQYTQRDQALELKASVRDISGSLTEVQICWKSTLPTATANFGLRKDYGATTWSKGFTIPAVDTCFLDTIPTGTLYQYGVAKDTNVYGDRIYGYLTAGNKVDAVLNRGTVVLVYDTTYDATLSSAYFSFKKDLIGDGWQINEFRVDSGTSIATVKAGIVSRYTANPTNVNTVILIGNIKVPYSGDFRSTGNYPPDGHSPDHDGAWSADIYYGDINSSSWTDASVTNTTGTRSANNNNTGDGKFDQSTIPTLIELSVGRIDLSDMPAFSSTEDTLLLN